MLKNERCVNLRYNFLIGLWMSWKRGSSSNFNQLCHDTNHCLNAADNSVTRSDQLSPFGQPFLAQNVFAIKLRMKLPTHTTNIPCKQCDQIVRNFKSLWLFLRVYLVFGKILKLLW